MKKISRVAANSTEIHLGWACLETKAGDGAHAVAEFLLIELLGFQLGLLAKVHYGIWRSRL